MSNGPNNPGGGMYVPANWANEPPRRGPSLIGRLFMGMLMLAAMCLIPFIGLVLLVAVIGSMAGESSDGVQERFHSLSKTATDKVAIISVEGVIIDNEGFVKRQIDQVREDKSVKAVVLRVDSPGGSVSASDYLYHHLKKLVEDRDIPLVVSMGSLAASGGYYVSMAVGDQEDSIFVEPTTWTGSIGVIIPHYDVAGLMARFDVVDDSIMSAPLKDIGSPTKPMTPEERAVLQGLVDSAFARFKDIVRAGRPALADDDATLEKVTTGQVFTAEQALADGLADREGFIEEAILRAIELANLTADSAKVVKYRDSGDIWSLLSAKSAGGRATSGVSALAELASPRPYYLFTSLPHLLRTSR